MLDQYERRKTMKKGLHVIRALWEEPDLRRLWNTPLVEDEHQRSDGDRHMYDPLSFHLRQKDIENILMYLPSKKII